jgi:hypothetical protein
VDPAYGQWEAAKKEFSSLLDAATALNTQLRGEGAEAPLLQRIADRLRGIRDESSGYEREITRLRGAGLDPHEPAAASRVNADARSLEEELRGKLKAARRDRAHEQQHQEWVRRQEEAQQRDTSARSVIERVSQEIPSLEAVFEEKVAAVAALDSIPKRERPDTWQKQRTEAFDQRRQAERRLSDAREEKKKAEDTAAKAGAELKRTFEFRWTDGGEPASASNPSRGKVKQGAAGFALDSDTAAGGGSERQAWGVSLPAQALPRVGQLWRLQDRRWLVITDWSELEEAEREAVRIGLTADSVVARPQ